MYDDGDVNGHRYITADFVTSVLGHLFSWLYLKAKILKTKNMKFKEMNKNTKFIKEEEEEGEASVSNDKES